MNFPITRVFKPLLSIVIVTCISFSCKESLPAGEENEVLAGNCNVAEFTEFGRSYSFEYDSDGLPIKLFRIVEGFDPILYQKFEYKERKLTAIHRVTLEGRSYIETQFEYKNDLLHIIRIFNGQIQAVSDTVFSVKEKERIEFGYGLNSKPRSLTRWFAEDQGGFSKSHESEFEYNAAGNLTAEKMHAFARQTVLEANYLFEYFYDDKANTQKQLNYLFFSATDSPAKLFSINNMNKLRLSYDNKTLREQLFKLVYSSKENIVADDYRYSGIKWICE